MKGTLATPPRSAGNPSELDFQGREPELSVDRTGGAPLRELAFRATDGLEISLLWNAAAGGLAVSVHDTRSGDVFEVPAPRDRALEVFYHPYAYAARHGIEYSVPALEPEDSHV
jgi:hypothetical protein